MPPGAKTNVERGGQRKRAGAARRLLPPRYTKNASLTIRVFPEVEPLTLYSTHGVISVLKISISTPN
jgi:hypothetical protein